MINNKSQECKLVGVKKGDEDARLPMLYIYIYIYLTIKTITIIIKIFIPLSAKDV